MLNKDTFYHACEPATKVLRDGVSIEADVRLSVSAFLTHEQFAVVDDEVLKAQRVKTKAALWFMLYGNIAATLECVAARCEDHDIADELRSLVAKLAP